MNRIPIKLEIGIRLATRITLMAAATMAIALAAVLVAPKIVGGQSLSVLSGSMAPAVNTGDMVVVVPQPATDIHVGQIVAFNDPNGSGRLYQHRVQSVREDNGQMIVVTKGDANNTGEHWQTPTGTDVGRVMLVVPYIGSVIGRITGGEPVQLMGRDIPLGTLLITAILFVLAGFVIAGILRSSSAKKEDEPGETGSAGHEPSTTFVHHQEEGPTHA